MGQFLVSQELPTRISLIFLLYACAYAHARTHARARARMHVRTQIPDMEEEGGGREVQSDRYDLAATHQDVRAMTEMSGTGR